MGAAAQKKQDPDQTLYAELGAGGGRKGPKPDYKPESNYSEVKVDEMGYPARGPTSDSRDPPRYPTNVNRDPSRRYSPLPKDDFDVGVIV